MHFVVCVCGGGGGGGGVVRTIELHIRWGGGECVQGSHLPKRSTMYRAFFRAVIGRCSPELGQPTQKSMQFDETASSGRGRQGDADGLSGWRILPACKHIFSGKIS